MGRKVRLDKWLVDQAIAPSLVLAREWIAQGLVLVDGVPASRPAAQVDVDRSVTVRDPEPSWVGRGALKLLGVLGPLGVDVSGRVCADLGASTGGFTEVLLRGGAARVYAVDVGRGLLHERVRSDARVVVMDEVNARHLEALPEPIDLVVADLAFISIRKVLPAVFRILRPGGRALVLVKPQFEVPAAQVEAGGVVRDPRARLAAIEAVGEAAATLGLRVCGGMDSPVAGARSGNVEHFLHLARSSPADGPEGW